jgi:cytochrome P450
MRMMPPVYLTASIVMKKPVKCGNINILSSTKTSFLLGNL